MSAGDVHSILYRGVDPLTSTVQKRPEKVKIQRYWPGKAPEGTEEFDEFEEDEKSNELPRVVDDVDEYVNIDTSVQDRRLRRLNNASTSLPQDEKIKARKKYLQKILEDEEIAVDGKELEREYVSHDEVDVVHLGAQVSTTEIEDNREKLREVLLKKRIEEEAQLDLLQKNQDLAESDTSSEASSNEVDDFATHSMVKPIFVPKENRQTVKTREIEEIEAMIKQDELKSKVAERKHQSHQMLIQAIQKDEAGSIPTDAKVEETNGVMPDDSDDLNEAEEYEMWKVRELQRIKRDRENRLAIDSLKEFVQTRREMTEEQRKLNDQILDKDAPTREAKQKYTFMQKYYHKGAYFQDKAQLGEEPLYLRDYSKPVGEDSLDKSLLPKSMRLRRGEFGRQGQTKHTHLADMDTTDRTSAWVTQGKNDPKIQSQQFERPAIRKN